jgi:hypothetical protein
MEHVSTRYQQGSFLRLWHKPDVLQVATEVNPIPRHFPSLYAASVAAIGRLDPVNIGYFLNMMRKCAIGTALLLLQNPRPETMPSYAEKLRNFIISTCSFSEFADIDYSELFALVERFMDERRAADPRAVDREASLVPIIGATGIIRAEMHNESIVSRFFRAWTMSLMPIFHERLNFKQFYKVSQGMRKAGLLRGPNLRLPIIVHFRRAMPTEDKYRPAGDRIALTAFCQPAQTIPADSTCAVCVSDLEVGAEDPDEKPVFTSCNHYFHQTCLVSWVNDSAMPTANTCPSCRTVLCEGRRRVPASMPEERAPVYDDDVEIYSLFNDDDSMFIE